MLTQIIQNLILNYIPEDPSRIDGFLLTLDECTLEEFPFSALFVTPTAAKSKNTSCYVFSTK